MAEFIAVPTVEIPMIDDTETSTRPNNRQHPEARNWLTSNRNSYCFAGNRFEHKDKALDFVEQLYRVGALRVEVTDIYDEEWRIGTEGGPYADTLRVHLPSDSDLLAELMLLCMDADEFSVSGSTAARLWWD